MKEMKKQYKTTKNANNYQEEQKWQDSYSCWVYWQKL